MEGNELKKMEAGALCSSPTLVPSLIILFVLLLTSNVNAATLSCSVKASCDANETDVLHMSNLSNAHAQLPNQSTYNYSICCIDLDSDTGIGNSSGTAFLHLSDVTNAQVQKTNESGYNYSAYIHATDSAYNISCGYGTNSCTGYDTCLASISNNTNAHIGNCSAYSSTVCCSLNALNTPPVVENVTLNSTYGTNLTYENLTVYWDVYDADGDNITNITNWYLNDTSITYLNLEFEPDGDQNATDYSNNSNDGTAEGDVPYNATGGYEGTGAYNFEGSGSEDGINTGGWNITSAPFSVEAHIYAVSYTTNWNSIVAKWDNVNNKRSWGLYTHLASGRPTLCISSAGTNSFCERAIDGVPTGEWHHIAATYNGIDGSGIRIYVDGVLQSTTTYINTSGLSGSPFDTNTTVYVGRSESVSNAPFYFDGRIDNVRVYNRTLTPEQVALLAQNRTDMISFNETEIGDTWQACITPNDRTQNGNEVCSNTLTIPTTPPIAENVTLSSTYGTNFTNENLTLYWDAYDIDGDNVTNITNWYLNGSSTTYINLAFEPDEDQNATDYSNNSRDGTAEGGVPYTATGGYAGTGAYDFEGAASGDGINTGGWNITGAFSAEVWYYSDSNAAQRAVAGKWDSDNENRSWLLGTLATTGRPLFCLSSAGIAASSRCKNGDASLAAGQWYHVVITYDGVDHNGMKIYVDGTAQSLSLYGGAGNPTGAPYASDTTVYVGRAASVGGSQQNFDGRIDDVRVYNRELSAEQVLALYNNRTDLIVSQETSADDVWIGCITPNDHTLNGNEVCSNNLTVRPTNIPPVLENVTLNSTYGTNYTNENLTVYWDAYDADSADIYNITNWYIDGKSLAVLNMPFEAPGGNESIWTKDYSSYANHGNVHGATWSSSGGYDDWGAYSYDGSSNYIDLGNDSSLKIGLGNFTISARFKTSNLGTDRIILADRNTGTVGTVEGFVLGICGATAGFCAGSTDDGEMRFYAEDSGGQNGIIDWNGADVDDGNWHSVTITWNRGDSNPLMYIDGVEQTVVVNSFAGVDDVSPSTNLTIGMRPNGAQYFEGYIDQLVLFNRSLSEEQVVALHNNRTDFIVSNETSIGDVWQACITPNDRTEDGLQNCSNSLTVLAPVPNTPPVAENVTLNSTYGTNHTTENLTVYWDSYDANADDIKNITNWRKNDIPIAVLNMPFEATGGNESTWAKDYSGFDNHVSTISGATWNATGGYDGFGAYEFDGSNDVILIPHSSSLENSGEFTISLRIKPLDRNTYQGLVMKQASYRYAFAINDAGSTYRLEFYCNGEALWRTGTNNTLPYGEWRNVAVTYDGTNITFYVDGQYDGTNTCTPGTSTSNLRLGNWASFYYKGTMDDVMIFNESLSQEQIRLIHQNRTDVIHSVETYPYDVWQACVTPNDRTEDGNESCSNNLTIRGPNFPPVAENVILNSTYGTNYTNENLTVYWDAYDTDNDSIKNITSWYLNNSPLMLLNMPFEANNGSESTSTKDYSNNSNDGTVVGATWNSSGGYDGFGAYHFNGGTDYIDGTGYQDQVFTASAWIYAETANQLKGIVEYSDSSSVRYGIGLDTQGTPCIFYYFNLGGRYRCATSGTMDNAWHHVVGTFDGTTATIYVDGSPITLGSENIANAAVSSNDLKIGIRTEAGNNNFKGTIDEVVLYNRSLSAEEVLVLYNNRTDLIVSNETSPGDIWQACITPNDGTEDGNESCSNTLTVLEVNVLPVVENVVLNSTYGTNYTTENLTVYWDAYDSWDTPDPDADAIKNITNWRKNDIPIAVLNMPFEATGGNESTWAKDYSGFDNHVSTISGATWNATGGYDGFGAYEFDGSGDYIDIAHSSSLEDTGEFTISLKIKPEDSFYDWQGLVFKTGSYKYGFAIHDEGSTYRLNYFCNTEGWREGTNTTLPYGQWRDVAVAFDGTNITFYVDGQYDGTATCTPGSSGTQLRIGYWSSNFYFNGTMDELMIFNESLSQEQIRLIHQNRTDVIHSSMTSKDDVWQACITPNDGFEDGLENCSNNLTVLEFVSYNITDCQEISSNGTYTLTADLTGYLSSGACLNITADNVTVLCDGHSISDDGVGYGVWFDSVDNVILRDCAITNYSSGAHVHNSSNCQLINVNSTDSDYDFYVEGSSDVKFTESNAYRGSNGALYITDSIRIGVDPSYFCDSPYGILLNNTNHTRVDDSIACRNSQIGIYVLDSHNVTVDNSRTYNNALDLRIENNRGTAVDFTATRLTFDGPAGDWTDYTTMDIADSVAASTSYDLNWTSLPAALPPNWTAFHNKYVDITNGTGSVSIDTVVWRWTDSESAGFNESLLDIWEYSTGGWNIIASALNAIANTLTVSNLVPSSDYGPLYNGTPFEAIDIYGANVSNVTEVRWDEGPAGSAALQGGNLSDYDITSQSLTDRWAAYTGNVSGSLLLTGDSASNYVYQWAWDSSDGGAICLTTNNSLTRLDVLGASGGDIDNAWGFSASASDSGTNTFNQTNCTIEIGSSNISNAGYVDNGQTGGFETCALKQNITTYEKGQLLFCGNIIQNGLTWNGSYADFEVMVPAAYGLTATETYYFYLNLD